MATETNAMFDMPDVRAKDAPDVLATLRAYDAAWYAGYWSQRAVHAQDVGFEEYAAYCRAQATAWKG